MAGTLFKNVLIEYGGDGLATGKAVVDGVQFTIPASMLGSVGNINVTSGINSVGKAFVAKTIMWQVPTGGAGYAPGYYPNFATASSVQVDFFPQVGAQAIDLSASPGSSGATTGAFWIGPAQ